MNVSRCQSEQSKTVPEWNHSAVITVDISHALTTMPLVTLIHFRRTHSQLSFTINKVAQNSPKNWTSSQPQITKPRRTLVLPVRVIVPSIGEDSPKTISQKNSSEKKTNSQTKIGEMLSKYLSWLISVTSLRLRLAPRLKSWLCSEDLPLSRCLSGLKQYEEKRELHTHFKRLTHVSC